MIHITYKGKKEDLILELVHVMEENPELAEIIESATGIFGPTELVEMNQTAAQAVEYMRGYENS